VKRSHVQPDQAIEKGIPGILLMDRLQTAAEAFEKLW
jgi:hypothetical protein